MMLRGPRTVCDSAHPGLALANAVTSALLLTCTRMPARANEAGRGNEATGDPGQVEQAMGTA